MSNLSLSKPSALFSPGIHHSDEDDRQAIAAVLRSYTESVETGDYERFESLLLHRDISFSGLRSLTEYERNDDPVDLKNYKNFKTSIFDSGIAFKQKFYNQKIEQDESLAQVSLDFVTTNTVSGERTYGWKVLQLLKIRGAWKIVSEFYTGRPYESGR